MDQNDFFFFFLHFVVNNSLGYDIKITTHSEIKDAEKQTPYKDLSALIFVGFLKEKRK